MDMYCGHCGEPFDADELHGGWIGPDDKPMEYTSGVAAFRRKGCPAIARECNPATVSSVEQRAAADAWDLTHYADEQGSMVEDMIALGAYFDEVNS